MVREKFESLNSELNLIFTQFTVQIYKIEILNQVKLNDDITISHKVKTIQWISMGSNKHLMKLRKIY